MSDGRNILQLAGDWWEERQARHAPAETVGRVGRRRWMPSPGSALFTLLVVVGLHWAQSAGAFPGILSQSAVATPSGNIAYQGRLSNTDGTPLTGVYPMIFRLYDVSSGGTPVWEEQWTGPNSVQVSDGLFNVMLGSLGAIPTNVVTDNETLFLGITVGTDDEMAPRVQLGNVPWAVQALTVPDRSVTTAKIDDGAVTQVKLGPDVSMVPPDGSVTAAKLADGSVTSRKLARALTSVMASEAIHMPQNQVAHDVLTVQVDPDVPSLLSINGSVGGSNENEDAFFEVYIRVDGVAVARAEKWNRRSFGETIAIAADVWVDAGEHTVTLRAKSWHDDSAIVSGPRTRLSVAEG